MFRYVKFSELCGKIFSSVQVNDDEIIFTTNTNEIFKMYHNQDCCEHVYIESVVGDVNDLIDAPILVAEESTNSNNQMDGQDHESFTWTFYKLATVKGYVDIRWYGSSNGWYSESVSLENITNIQCLPTEINELISVQPLESPSGITFKLKLPRMPDE